MICVICTKKDVVTGICPDCKTYYFFVMNLKKWQGILGGKAKNIPREMFCPLLENKN